MDKKIIVMGTRASKLSQIQTEIVKKKLQKLFPATQFETKIITTKGDKNMKPIPLDTVGKGWFTKELDKELLEGKIDLAVHSLKDIPEDLPNGIVIAAIPEREDAREAFISNKNVLFEKLKRGAIIGTDSTRRKAQILNKRSDVKVRSIRGNVITRLEKLDKGEYDGIFLAVAGLKRLGIENRITQYFSEKDFVPSPGQGALAVTVKKTDKTLIAKLKKLNHADTVTAVEVERAFAKALGAGCKMPVAAYATIRQSKILLRGAVGSLDGKYLYKDFLQGSISAPGRVGNNMADNFLDKGYSWFDKPKFVVITRQQNVSIKTQKDIEALGLRTFFYPGISIAKSTLTKKVKKIINNIDSFDWLIFTSQNGVRFFIAAIEDEGIPVTSLKRKKIAVVGKKTGEAVKKYGLPVDFIPSKFTTEALAKELRVKKGEKVLMARANLATPVLTQKLQEKGALVTDIQIYRTSFIENDSPEFETLLENQQIYCINFTSPSTVKGFINNIKNSGIKKKVLELTALSIGPVTTRELEKQGFQNIITADIFTINGMIAKLKESIIIE